MLVLNVPEGTPIEIISDITAAPIRFEVYGAVKTPGIYEAEDRIRVEDVVALAGGFTDDADIEKSGLTRFVYDSDQIWIPTKGAEGVKTTAVLGSMQGRVNLNTAGLEELMQLPGIGEKRAQDIIAFREEKGGFSDLQDLLEVSGIGESVLQNLYDFVVIE